MFIQTKLADFRKPAGVNTLKVYLLSPLLHCDYILLLSIIFSSCWILFHEGLKPSYSYVQLNYIIGLFSLKFFDIVNHLVVLMAEMSGCPPISILPSSIARAYYAIFTWARGHWGQWPHFAASLVSVVAKWLSRHGVFGFPKNTF